MQDLKDKLKYMVAGGGKLEGSVYWPSVSSSSVTAAVNCSKSNRLLKKIKIESLTTVSVTVLLNWHDWTPKLSPLDGPWWKVTLIKGNMTESHGGIRWKQRNRTIEISPHLIDCCFLFTSTTPSAPNYFSTVALLFLQSGITPGSSWPRWPDMC